MGVPTFRIEVRKLYQSQPYSNDYQVEADAMSKAVTMADAIVAFERSFFLDSVSFVYYRISSAAVGDRTFRHVTLNLAGLIGAAGKDPLPLFNTVRLDLQTADSDPCRKYYRPPVYEAFQTDGVLDAGWRATIAANCATMISAFPAGTRIVSSIGNIVLSGVVFPRVQMRQLHRHRRPATP
jgi:hypothetical protein